MRPSDSLASVGCALRCPLRAAYRRADAVLDRAARASADACPPESGHRISASPVSRRRGQGLPGCWIVLFVRAVDCDPAGCTVSSPHRSATALLPSGLSTPWASGIGQFRGSTSHGPRVRVPTHRRAGYPPRRKARYRPAGLALIGRASHPLDDSPNFQSHVPPSLRTTISWSHWQFAAPQARIDSRPTRSLPSPGGDFNGLGGSQRALPRARRG